MTRRASERLAIVAVTVMVLALGLTTPRPAMPPFLPIGGYQAYDAATPPRVIALAPVLHAPWSGTPSMPVAIFAAMGVLAVLWRAGHVLGGTSWGAVAVVAAFAVRPESGQMVALAAPPMLAVALLWLALAAAAIVAPATASRRARVVAGAAVAVACGVWPPALAAVPLVAGRAADAWRRRDGVVLVGTGLLGALLGALAWATTAASGGETWRLADVVAVARESEAALAGAYPWPPLSVVALPLALAVVGLATSGDGVRGTQRRAALATGGVASGLLFALLPGWRAEIARAITWVLWAFVPAGLAWVSSQAPARRRAVASAVVTTALVLSGALARVRQTDLVEPTAFAAALGAALGTDPQTLSQADGDGPGRVIVAEDPRVDTALVAWGGRAVRRLRPHPDVVARAAAGGAPVLAGPAARAALELHGFRFRPGPGVATPVPFGWARVEGSFRCTSVGARWSDLAGLEYTGRLGLHVPAGPGRLELVVAGLGPQRVTLATRDGRRLGTLASGAARDLDDLPPVLWPGDGRLPPADMSAVRVTVPAAADFAIDEALGLGARAPLVAVRMTGGAAAVVCAAPLPHDDPFDLATATAVDLPLADRVYFGRGVGEVERQGEAAFRRVAAGASILVPSSTARAVTVRLTIGAAAPPPAGASVALEVNGVLLAPQTLGGDTAAYEWPVPAALWVDGTNELTIDAPVALELHGVRLERH